MNHLEEKYQKWLVEFGRWIGGSGRISDVAKFCEISKQSCTRYFVSRTHEPSASVFFRSLMYWQRNGHNHHYSYHSPPGDEFQTWNVLQHVPKVESAIEESKTGTASWRRRNSKSGLQPG